MRQVSRKRAAELRQRRELLTRSTPESCPRCHREPCIDPHELVRRSQRLHAAAELDLIVPIGRSCHDWIGEHPAAAVAEGWALWSHQTAEADLARASLLRLAGSTGLPWVAATDTAAGTEKAPPPVSGPARAKDTTVPGKERVLTLRVGAEQLAQLDGFAEQLPRKPDGSLNRSDALRAMLHIASGHPGEVEQALAAWRIHVERQGQQATHTTITGRDWGPDPKRPKGK